MNQGFSYYFKNGLMNAFRCYRKVGFSTRLILLAYFFMSFLGKLFLFTRPLFLIADSNLAIMAKEANAISFEKIFANCGDGKRYFKLLCASFIISSLIAIIIVICAIPGVISLCSFILAASASYATIVTTAVLTFVPFGAIALYLTVLILITYSPMGYLINKNPNLDVGDLLLLSRNAMRKVKFTTFLINVVYYLIQIAYYGIPVIIFTLTALYSYLGVFISASILIIAVILLNIFIMQGFYLGRKISNYNIYQFANTDHIEVVKPNVDNSELTPILPSVDGDEVESENEDQDK